MENTLYINRGALYLATNFFAKDEEDITGRVWFEKGTGTAVRVTALDGYSLISFLFENANPSEKEFATFGLNFSTSTIKMLKPSKNEPRKDVALNLNVEDKEATLIIGESNINLIIYDYVSKSLISDIWQKFKKYETGEKTTEQPLVSVFDLKQLNLFNFKKIFTECSEPSFTKVGEASIVNFGNLPAGIQARGLIMHFKESTNKEFHADRYGASFPEWLF